MKRSIFAMLLAVSSSSFADCVSASMMNRVQILAPTTILIWNGAGNGAIIKTLTPLVPGSQVTLLKDYFCDFERGVMLINGQKIDAQIVKQF